MNPIYYLLVYKTGAMFVCKVVNFTAEGWEIEMVNSTYKKNRKISAQSPIMTVCSDVEQAQQWLERVNGN